MTALFWASVAMVAWPYVGFPLVVLARARLAPRPARPAPIEPTVSLLVAAHDEEAVIGARIENALALDYPADRFELIVASDGSTDATDAIVSRYTGDPRVRLLALERGGKAKALNAAVESSRGDVLVFSDANTSYEPGAVRALVRWFADPEVGGVAGDQRYAERDDGAAGERQYWDLDRMLKAAESAAGSTVSATGAIYAIRRELFWEVAEGVTDDFATSTAVVAQGKRLLFDPEAVAVEPPAATDGDEYRRKVRIMTRGLRGVALRRELLDPRRHGFYAIQLASHKVLRRAVVFPLLTIAAVAPFLARRGGPYRLAALGQAVVYGLGGVGLAARRRRWARAKPIALPAYFCLVNAAALRAFANLLSGNAVTRWEPIRVLDDAAPDRVEVVHR